MIENPLSCSLSLRYVYLATFFARKVSTTEGVEVVQRDDSLLEWLVIQDETI
jgi:hypothetical protein